MHMNEVAHGTGKLLLLYINTLVHFKYIISFNRLTCNALASKGELECLKYAHEHGCVWGEATCVLAGKEFRSR